jgi:hypothetical protein
VQSPAPADAPIAVAEPGDWDVALAPENQPGTWALHFAESFVGTPYSQASRNDCSGAASQLINVALGQDPRSSFMSTQTAPQWLASRGFVMGDGPPGTLRVGWYNHGSAPNDGHMAITLPDGTYAESGSSHGTFELGGSAAGAEDSEFDHHAYLPISVGIYEVAEGEHYGSEAMQAAEHGANEGTETVRDASSHDV